MLRITQKIIVRNLERRDAQSVVINYIRLIYQLNHCNYTCKLSISIDIHKISRWGIRATAFSKVHLNFSCRFHNISLLNFYIPKFTINFICGRNQVWMKASIENSYEK